MNEKEVIENKNNKDFVLKAVSENGKFFRSSISGIAR